MIGGSTPVEIISLEEVSESELPAGNSLDLSCPPLSLGAETFEIKRTETFEILTEDLTEDSIMPVNTKPDNRDDSAIRVEAAPKKRKTCHIKKDPIF